MKRGFGDGEKWERAARSRIVMDRVIAEGADLQVLPVASPDFPHTQAGVDRLAGDGGAENVHLNRKVRRGCKSGSNRFIPFTESRCVK